MVSDRLWARISMTSPDWMVRAAGKLNVPLYRFSGGRLGGRFAKAPVLLLTTTGRRSGEARTTPVLYLADADRLVVIGSNAGNERPGVGAQSGRGSQRRGRDRQRAARRPRSRRRG